MEYSKKEAKRIVGMVYRMYSPRGTYSRESITIMRFLALTEKLEVAIRSRAIGERDAIVLELVNLFHQNAV